MSDTANLYNIRYICGVEARRVIPEVQWYGSEFGKRYIAYHWEGAELADCSRLGQVSDSVEVTWLPTRVVG